MTARSAEGFKRQLNVTKQGGMIPSLFRGWKDWKEGDFLMGEFLETRESDYNGKPTPNHVCKVVECNFQVETKNGKVDPVGKVFTVNSAGTLNNLLVDANKGDTFQFIYEGKHRGSNPSDKQAYHTFSNVVLEAKEQSSASSSEASDDYGL